MQPLTAMHTEYAEKMLAKAGLQQWDRDVWRATVGLDCWMVARVIAGDERIAVVWQDRNGVQVQPEVSVPISYHGGNILTAIAGVAVAARYRDH